MVADKNKKKQKQKTAKRQADTARRPKQKPVRSAVKKRGADSIRQETVRSKKSKKGKSRSAGIANEYNSQLESARNTGRKNVRGSKQENARKSDKEKLRDGRQENARKSGKEKLRGGRQENARKSGGKGRKKRRAIRKTWLTICTVLLLFGGIGFLVWYFSFEAVDLADYLEVSFSGYDTRGTASLSFQESEKYGSFLEDVDISLLSENGSLQNGDCLDISFIYDKAAAREQKLRIRSDECAVEVSRLAEGKSLTAEELFSGVSLVYDGIAPELSVAVSNESADPFLQTISYEITDGEALYDAGDSFTLTASVSEEDAVENGYIPPSPSECNRVYTIDGVDRYIRDASELSQEQIQTLNQTAASLFGDATEYGLRIFSEANLMPIWVNGKTTFVWSNPRLISAYLNVLRPEYFQEVQSHDNDVKLVYVVTLSQADGVACDAEVVVQFNNLIRNADGSCDLALDSGKIIAASYSNNNIKDLVTDTYDEEYEAVKLDLS